MYGKAFLMTAVAGVCSPAEPAGAAAVECRSVAPVRAIAGLDADEACALVRARAQSALAASSRARGAALTIELDLSRSGSAIAQVSERRAGGAHTYPEVAIDVMDRALAREDLVRLADAIVMAVSAGPQPH